MIVPNLNIQKYINKSAEISQKITNKRSNWYAHLLRYEITLKNCPGNLGSYFSLLEGLFYYASFLQSLPKAIPLFHRLEVKSSNLIERFQKNLKENLLIQLSPHGIDGITCSNQYGENTSFSLEIRSDILKEEGKKEIVDLIVMECINTALQSLLYDIEAIELGQAYLMEKKLSLIHEDFDSEIVSAQVKIDNEKAISSVVFENETDFIPSAIADYKTKVNDAVNAFNAEFAKCKKMTDFSHGYRMNLPSILTDAFEDELFNKSVNPIFQSNDKNEDFIVEESHFSTRNQSIVGSGKISKERLISIAKIANERNFYETFTLFASKIKAI